MVGGDRWIPFQKPATLIERLPDDTLESFLEASKTDQCLGDVLGLGISQRATIEGMPGPTGARSLVMLSILWTSYQLSLDVPPLGGQPVLNRIRITTAVKAYRRA